MNQKQLILFNVILPMIIGGFLYIFFRDSHLLMFQWFDTIHIHDSIIELRRNYFSDILIPHWISYNLPDGIWIYSLTSLMIIIWNKNQTYNKYFWIILGPLLGISSEIGQYLELVSGTFDMLDFLFCIVGSILPFLFLYKKQSIIVN